MNEVGTLAFAALSGTLNSPKKGPTGPLAMASASSDRLSRPFKCPGSAIRTRASKKPARKRRRVCYEEAGSIGGDGDTTWTNSERLALANRDANRFPIYRVKDKETQFRQQFSIPLLNKDCSDFNLSRPAPTLGMRRGATFVAKPLHDPSGEFAIVLYDPTVDGRPLGSSEDGPEPEALPELKVPLMHKSLAEILGIKKEVDQARPKLPVVIDPKLAKVLRPHQVEGVKVSSPSPNRLVRALTSLPSSCTSAPPA